MTWYTFEVTPIVHGPIVAENLRMVARDPLTRAALPDDAEVLRRRLDNSERFFFSPSAAGVFEPFIKTYGGIPCEPPFEGETLPGSLLRLELDLCAWEQVGCKAALAK